MVMKNYVKCYEVMYAHMLRIITVYTYSECIIYVRTCDKYITQHLHDWCYL